MIGVPARRPYAAAAATVAVVVAVVMPSPVTTATSPDTTSTMASDLIEVDIRPLSPARFPDGGPLARSAADDRDASVAAITGALAWHSAGVDGSGVRVGVIDYFDTMYWQPDVHGPLPVAGVTARCFDRGRDCTAEFFDGRDRGGEDHGVAVVEVLTTMAPGVDVVIGRAETVSDYELLIDWFASVGVDVITRSLGSRYDGPGDGRGRLGDVAARAVAGGMTWVNSAGNNADGNYYRRPVRVVGDRVAFDPDGIETLLPMAGCVQLGGVRWAQDWDLPPEQRTDYDVVLWESPIGRPDSGRVIARSASRQVDGAPPLEHIAGRHCPSAGSVLHLEVRLVHGDPTGDVLEILDYAQGPARYTSADHSAAVPIVDSDTVGVIAVGAVTAGRNGSIAPYSSLGPTNDGRIAPSLSAPVGFVSEVAGGPFSGTSAAAPVVAGAAALVLAAGLAAGPAAVEHLLRTAAIDRGRLGPDNAHGHGELRLPPPVAGWDGDPSRSVASRYVPLARAQRVLDTRPAGSVGPPDLLGVTAPGDVRRLPVRGVHGVPSDATAVALNVTTVGPDRRGWVQVLPLWEAELAGSSTVNTDAAGQNRANLSVVPIASDGTVAFHTSAAGHLVVDLAGWFEPAPGPVAAGRFVPFDRPERVLDTRLTGQPVRSGDTVDVPNPAGSVDSMAALVVTVTAVRPRGRGWLQAFTSGDDAAVGTTSTVNTSAGSTAAGTAIVPVGDSTVAVHAEFGPGGSAHVLVDAVGYFTDASATPADTGRFVPVSPRRMVDSRMSGTGLADGESIVVDSGAVGGASSVLWNLTAVGSTRAGFAFATPDGADRPSTSSLNWTFPRETRAAAAITGVVAGRARFGVDDQGHPAVADLTHLVVDMFGYFT